MTVEEEIKKLEEEILHTQKNKSTEHHIGRLKAKIARLREEKEKQAKAARKSTGIRKSGDATVVLVGPMGSGKSTLLNRLTGAKASDDPMTTTPGIMSHKGAKIQILDVPDILLFRDAIPTVRNSDLAVFVLEPSRLDPSPYVELLYESGVRINKRPPDIIIRKNTKGGINIISTVDSGIDRTSIESILSEYKIHSADVILREDLTQDRFIDALEDRKYLKAIAVMNKAEMADRAPKGLIPVSALEGTGIDDLKDRIFDKLDLIRIYNKPQGSQPDMNDPMILNSGSTVGELCDMIHKYFRKRFRYASIWGASAKHAGQRAGLDHVLSDGDIITIVIEK
jgi:uncharacterized protein